MIVGEIKLISGTSNRPLAEEISKILKVPLTPVTIKKFSDGETYIKIEESVRGHDVYIIQSTCHPANDNVMELMILIDALRRASAWRISVVIPFFGYARQDRKALPREAIAAKLIANMLTAAGASRILVFNIHSDQIQGFFDIPLDYVSALPLIADYFKTKDLKNALAIAPDEGSIKPNKQLAQRLGIPLVMIYKERSKTQLDTFEDMKVLGDVKGKDCFMWDDEINTGGTIVRAINLLKEQGARNIYVSCTHPILAGPAVERLNNAPIKELVVTNTIPLKDKKLKNVKVISIARTVADLMQIINAGKPMGKYLQEK